MYVLYRYTFKTSDMKKYLKLFVLIVLVSCFPIVAKSQYYQIANQLTGLIRPALTGGSGYKGYADVSYLAGLGNRRVDFVGISTSQGFNYRSWFYMGVGIGVDIAMGHVNPQFGMESTGPYWQHGYKKTGVMVPVFTDFRFNIGSQNSTAFFIDARIGASFLMGSNYLAVADGFITNREYFYLRPSLGVRIPVAKGGRQAMDIGLSYQLLTSNYWYNTPSPYNVTLSSLGAVVSFEW